MRRVAVFVAASVMLLLSGLRVSPAQSEPWWTTDRLHRLEQTIDYHLSSMYVRCVRLEERVMAR